MNLHPISFAKGLHVISAEAPDAWIWKNGPAVHRFAQKTRERAERFKPAEDDVGWIVPTGDAKDCGKFYKLGGESYGLWKYEEERAKASESAATFWAFVLLGIPGFLVIVTIASFFARR